MTGKAPRGDSLAQARAYLFRPDVFEEGSTCPCCDGTVRLRKRRLNAGMAAILCWLTRRYRKTREWVDVHADGPRFALRSNEVSRLVHWGLVEAKPNTDPARRDSGLWRPTMRGVLFSEGKLRVPSHAYIYNNRCYRMSEETLDVHEALRRGQFDYRELMGVAS